MNDEEINLKKIGMISTHIKNMIDVVNSNSLMLDRNELQLYKRDIVDCMVKVDKLIEKIKL